MPETQEVTAYPPITPAWTNLAVSKELIENNDISSCDNQSDTASLQSDRLTIATNNDLSPRSASSSSSSSNKENNNGIEHPIVDSHGKVRTFRCKRCPYVAITKRNYWNHTRNHIEPERLIACPACPFVTEHKHHFEFHALNHLKSKPFKCKLCDYTCVNKAMLNSHVKSHSAMYFYRCIDCNYSCKHCYQIRQHLKKLQHKRGVELNDDGTPNLQKVIYPDRAMSFPGLKIKKRKKTKTQQLAEDFSASLPQFQFNAMPIAASFDNVLPGYLPTNFVGGMCEKQDEFVERSAPIDYSRYSPASDTPTSSSMHEDEVESPVDLTDRTLAPLDLRKSNVSEPQNLLLHRVFNEHQTNEADAHLQLQLLRANLANMQRYAYYLERSLLY